jgi:hypothetical protein
VNKPFCSGWLRSTSALFGDSYLQLCPHRKQATPMCQEREYDLSAEMQTSRANKLPLILMRLTALSKSIGVVRFRSLCIDRGSFSSRRIGYAFKGANTVCLLLATRLFFSRYPLRLTALWIRGKNRSMEHNNFTSALCTDWAQICLKKALGRITPTLRSLWNSSCGNACIQRIVLPKVHLNASFYTHLQGSSKAIGWTHCPSML